MLEQGDDVRALAVTRKWLEVFPRHVAPYDESALSMLRCLYQTGNTNEADVFAEDLITRSVEWVEWIHTLTPQRRKASYFTEYRWSKLLERTLGVLHHYDRQGLLESLYYNN